MLFALMCQTVQLQGIDAHCFIPLHLLHKPPLLSSLAKTEVEKGRKRQAKASMAMYGIIASILTLLLAIGVALYTFLLPDSSQYSLKTHPLEKRTGQAAYITAYILSLLRAPLGLLPYLTKLFIIFILNIPYDSPRSTYFREVVNMLGDFLNLGLITFLVLLFIGPPTLQPLTCILYLPIVAELVRLLAERIPIIFSALWQLLPHRSIARTLQSRPQLRIVKRYCCSAAGPRHFFARKGLRHG